MILDSSFLNRFVYIENRSQTQCAFVITDQLVWAGTEFRPFRTSVPSPGKIWQESRIFFILFPLTSSVARCGVGSGRGVTPPSRACATELTQPSLPSFPSSLSFPLPKPEPRAGRENAAAPRIAHRDCALALVSPPAPPSLYPPTSSPLALPTTTTAAASIRPPPSKKVSNDND